MVVLGFAFAHWLRFSSGLIPRYVGQDDPVSPASSWASGYWRLILFGSLVVFLGLLSKDISRLSDLLSPRRIQARLMGVVAACLLVFLGFSLTVRTVPAISRAFVLCAAACIPLCVYTWRVLVGRVLRRPFLSRWLRQRLLVVGCNGDACRIHTSVLKDPFRCVDFVGCVRGHEAGGNGDVPCPCVHASMRQIAATLEKHAVDVVVLTDPDIPQAEVMRVAAICENHQVEFKMIPRYFQILISGLRPALIGEVPVLGVEALPLNRPEVRLLKRGLDIAGALVGLVLSAPVILVFAGLLLWESPGPVFYRQVRMGRNGRLFTMFKIRSMRVNAEENGGAQWALEDDPRRLRIGASLPLTRIDPLLLG